MADRQKPPTGEIAAVSVPAAVNARFLVHRTTGMQRYAAEIASRLAGDVDLLRPRRALSGVLGHAWEQTALRMRARHRVLWSPNNTGPLGFRRQVVTIADVAPLDHPEWFSKQFALLYRATLGPLARSAGVVLAISEFTRVRLIEVLRVPPDRVRLALGGVGPQFDVPAAARVESVLAGHRLDAETYFLFVGSAVPRKNLGGLLRGFRAARSELPPGTQLVIAGEREAARAFAANEIRDDEPDVRWLGYVKDEDLPALMHGAIAVVVPSYYEGFGLPVAEAMACGAPVVAANATALPEVVGDAGVLFSLGDEASLPDALTKIAADAELRRRLRQAGVVRAQKFGWGSAAAATAAALNDVG